MTNNVQEELLPSILRLRIDRTLKTGARIESRNCNLSCIWCHHDYMTHTKGGKTAISNEAYVRFANTLIDVTNPSEVTVRISGDGEPTLSGADELSDLIRKMKQIKPVKSVKLTSNGILFGEMAASLKDAGLNGVTVSVNSLDPETFALYTGVDCLSQVLHSIQICRNVGLPTKINTIFSRLNSHEVQDFISYARLNPDVELRFFDIIPFDKLTRRFYLPLDKLENLLNSVAEKVVEKWGAYYYKEYHLAGGGNILVKQASINRCPNTTCTTRAKCREGCRASVRIRADGWLQPCGIRLDNAIDLQAPDITTEKIKLALKSGGKI